MRSLVLTLATLNLSALCVAQAAPNLICYYDSRVFLREGLPKFEFSDLELALQFCTHLIYGYAGINGETFEMQSINKPLDIYRRHFAQITMLKDIYPHIKFLLSVGGDRDLDHEEKYIKLLESGVQGQMRFINSALDFVRIFDFDGLDLALQLPRNKPRKVHSDAGMAWKSFKKFFTGDYIVDEQAETHKAQMSELVRNLNSALKASDLLLSLTVLPNVNSTWYFDAATIAHHVNMINLATFDFVTPVRNPEEADFTAPLYDTFGQNRLSHYNVNFQVDHWLLHHVPANKINVGIATYGRAWKITPDSGSSGIPLVAATNGPAPAGPQSETPGELNWSEICQLLSNSSNTNGKGPNAPLRRVSDPTKKYGTYAFRTPDKNGDHGMWVSYEDPDTAASKAEFVRSKNLGGVALFDLTQDDFRGQCTGDRFPILRAIKY